MMNASLYWVLLCIAALLAGCNRQESRTASQSAADASHSVIPEKPAAVPVPPNAAELLPEWFEEWQTAGVTLRPESFMNSWTDKLHGETFRLDAHPDWLPSRRPFLIYSPDSSKAIDLRTFDMDEQTGRAVHADRDDMVEVNVLDLNDGTGFVTLTCGTPCLYHDGAWVDDSTFIVAGTHHLMPGDGSNRGTTNAVAPALSVVSLADSARTTYEGPLVDPEVFGKARIARYLEVKLESLQKN